MDIAQAKAEIARRAFNAGFAFDPDEIVDGPLEGRTLVFLRSVRAFRTIENDDGSFSLEEFNSPIVWLNQLHPMLSNPRIEGTTLQYTTIAPWVTVMYPEFAILV